MILRNMKYYLISSVLATLLLVLTCWVGLNKINNAHIQELDSSKQIALNGFIFDEEYKRYINNDIGVWYIIDNKGYRIIPAEQYLNYSLINTFEGINIENRPNIVWELVEIIELTIKEGDKLSEIITYYALNHFRMDRDWYSNQILYINNITNPNKIRVGDIIKIPIYNDNKS